MKKFILGLLLVIPLVGKSIIILNGWNLVGTETKIDLVRTFSPYSNIEVVWAYDNVAQDWVAFGNNPNIEKNIYDNGFNQIKNIEPDKGFWVLNIGNKTEVKINNSIAQEENNSQIDHFTQTENLDLLKDITSQYFDILTYSQQQSIQKDKNNIYPNNKDLTVLTLLDINPENGLKILKNTKVALPYYISNDRVDVQLAYVDSSNKNIISPNIVDSTNGAFKVIDSNSILFLELEAKGELNQSASINLTVQTEDATKFDKEDLRVTIVDDNETYNSMSLFFTYNTIIIEEDDSRDIYFGISYTIDSNITVSIRSDLEMILADQNQFFNLQNVNNNIISTFISNENGVPFHFRLDAKGKAGDSIGLFLMAVDSQGMYDYKMFNVLIVAKGKGSYKSVN